MIIKTSAQYERRLVAVFCKLVNLPNQKPHQNFPLYGTVRTELNSGTAVTDIV